MKRSCSLALCIAATLLFVVTTASPTLAQAADQPLKLTAWAVSTGNVAPGTNQVIEIIIDKWSTVAEREQLISTFIEKGQDGLLKAFETVPVKGRIRVPNSTRANSTTNLNYGWELRYAMQTIDQDGGRRIVIGTDRVRPFEEVAAGGTSFPFTFAQIQLNRNGEGEGKLAIATEMQYDKASNTILYQHYSTEPVRLQQVKVQK